MTIKLDFDNREYPPHPDNFFYVHEEVVGGVGRVLSVKKTTWKEINMRRDFEQIIYGETRRQAIDRYMVSQRNKLGSLRNMLDVVQERLMITEHLV